MDNNQQQTYVQQPASANQSNTLAIVGFVLSFFFSITGLILSIIGLSKSKELNNGKGLAIAGIVISSLRIALLIAVCALWTSFAVALWPEIKDEITTATKCSQAYECDDSYVDGYASCYYKNESGEEETIKCPVDYDYSGSFYDSDDLDYSSIFGENE